MKVTLKGNTAVVETMVSAQDFEDFKGYGVFTVTDEAGDQVYGLNKGNSGSVSTYGITCNTTVGGKLAASFIFEGPAEAFKKKLDPAILALREHEAAILNNIDNIKTRLEGIEEVVTIEE